MVMVMGMVMRLDQGLDLGIVVRCRDPALTCHKGETRVARMNLRLTCHRRSDLDAKTGRGKGETETETETETTWDTFCRGGSRMRR